MKNHTQGNEMFQNQINPEISISPISLNMPQKKKKINFQETEIERSEKFVFELQNSKMRNHFQL